MKTNFRQFWAFFVIGFKSSLRSPSALFFGFFVPIIFIFSFAFFDTSSVKFELGMVSSAEKSEYSSSFKNTLNNIDIFHITTDSKDSLNKKLTKGDLDGYIEFVDSNQIILTTNSSRPQNTEVIRQSLETVSDKLTLGRNQLSSVFKISQDTINGRTGKYIDFVLPGVLGFSLLASAINGTAFSFVSLKKTLALKRLFATPSRSVDFILGQSLARLVFSFLQNLLLLVVASVFFGYHPKDGFVSIIQMMVIITFGLIVFLGMGYVVAGIASNDDQVAPLTNLLTLPQFLLAGTFFAVSGLPGWLQNFCKLLPLYNFNEAMRAVSLDGLYIWSPEVLTQLGFMSIWAIVIYYLASKVFSVKAT